MSYNAQSMSIADLMRDINSYYLPAIQREFVWPGRKVEALFDSLLRGYPVGTLLFWDVRKPAIHDFAFYELIREYDVRDSHNKNANLNDLDRCFGILDGQQRITSLFIGLKGTYTAKKPRLWRTNPDAYREKKLYINLLYEPSDNDVDQKFQIKFLEENKAKKTDEVYWFWVSEILKYKSREELREFRRSTIHRHNDVFEDMLDTLWTAIFERQSVSYFLETRQELDEVLQIFVRLNTGGTPLSYSDLLLSLATATWKTHDARKQVYDLVEDLNTKHGSFNFSKDFVLKSLLVLGDGDVRFKTRNIRKGEWLEGIWDDVKASLVLTIKLLKNFGFNWQTLTAPYSAIPIAYYLYKTGYDDVFLEDSFADDRDTIRIWLLQMLLSRAFRGRTDQLLTGIRATIRNSLDDGPHSGFPANEINHYLSSKRGLVFTDEQMEATVADTKYGSPYAFSTLAMLMPNPNYMQATYDIDHIHPASHFSRSKLRAAGMSDDDIEYARRRRDSLPNLQLLPSEINRVVKRAKPFRKWLDGYAYPELMKAQSLIPPDTDLSLVNFRVFHKMRKALLITELRRSMGTLVVSTAGTEEVDIEDMMTGEIDELELEPI